MQAGKRKILAGWEYDHLFPKSTGHDVVIKRNSELEDTIHFLPDAIRATLYQTKKIAEHLKGQNPYDTCKKIWHWVFRHIQYEKDEKGKEQIRSPQRTWHDRNWQNAPKKGVDCDDFTVLISSMLCNLKIKNILRVAKYTEENGFQHIYPVAVMKDGTEIPVDCVLDSFNYEVPYIEKIDQTMELQFLNGLPEENRPQKKLSIDAEDLSGDDFGELGKIKLNLKNSKFVKKVQTATKTVAKKVSTAAKKVGTAAKNTLHVVNKYNPGAALLRAGVLASLKLNVFNVAGNLRYTYLTQEQAKQRGFNLQRFAKLLNVREKLEKIFHGAGGEPKNLKKVILSGRGNQNKDVPLSGINENDALSQILGYNLYSEEISGVEGLSGLGEPATATALAAASSAMAALAALIKSIGGLKNGNSAPSETSSTTTDTPSDAPVVVPDTNPTTNNEPTEHTDSASTLTVNNSMPPQLRETSAPNGAANNSDTPPNGQPEMSTQDDATATTDNSSLPAKSEAKAPSENETTSQVSWWNQFTGWISENKMKVGIGLGIAVIATAVGVYAMKKDKNKSSSSNLSGFNRRKKKQRKKNKPHHHPAKIKIHKLK